MTNPNKTYIIQHKETRELFRARSGKTSWKQPGHAKNAWNQSAYEILNKYNLECVIEPSRWVGGQDNERCPRFDEQDIFEIVELKHESQDRLRQAIELLNKTLGRCDRQIHNEIVEFLNNEN